MSFTWGEAGRVALIGFFGVLAILSILAIAVSITGKLVHRFMPQSEQEKKK